MRRTKRWCLRRVHHVGRSLPTKPSSADCGGSYQSSRVGRCATTRCRVSTGWYHSITTVSTVFLQMRWYAIRCDIHPFVLNISFLTA